MVKENIGMDRLSCLPDSIIWAILTRLSLREATRCATLSRRFKCMPQCLHILNLSPSNLLSSPSLAEPNAVEAAERIIEHLLFFHFSPLQTFILSPHIFSRNPEVCCFSSASVSRWIKWAACRNVEEITLKDNGDCTCDSHPRELPPSFVLCQNLKTLHVECYSLLKFTISSSDSFRRLTTCTLIAIELGDNCFETFMAICTQLQSVEVESSYGLHNPKISAPNLKHLCVRLSEQAHCLTVKCPKLVDIVLENFGSAVINCSYIGIYGGLVKATFTDKNELISLQLDTSRCPYHSVSIVWIMKEIAHLKALKRVALLGGEELFQEKDNHGGYLATLPQLEDLSIGGSFVEHLEKASGIALCTTLPLRNLKKAHVEYKDRGLVLLRWMLRSSPELQIMNVGLRKSWNRSTRLGVLTELLNLTRASSQARITITYT